MTVVDLLRQCLAKGFAVVRTADGASLAPQREKAVCPKWLKDLLGKHRQDVIEFLDGESDGSIEVDVTPAPKSDEDYDPIDPSTRNGRLMLNWLENGTGSYGHRPEQLAPAEPNIPGRVGTDAGPGGDGGHEAEGGP